MKYILFFAVAIALLNCHKKTNPQPESFCDIILDPPLTVSHPYNYIKYKRNGKEIIIKDYFNSERNKILLFSTYVKEGDSSIIVTFNGRSTIGTYTKKCIDFEVGYLTFSFNENKNGPRLSSSTNTQPSSISISQNDTIVKGTFNFFLSDSSGNNATLTDGEFQFKK